MQCGILMDPIADIHAYKDSTVAMIQSAQQMGWDCFYFTQHDLFCQDERVFATVRPIRVGKIDHSDWAQVGAVETKALGEFDIILMRKDPPFDLEYIYTTYALELAQKEGVFVVNNPQSLRDANEKFFTLQFPQCCPPTLVSRDIKKLHAFWDEHHEVIYKPLAGMGGRSVFYVGKEGSNLSVILETLTHSQTVTIMAQCFIPEILTQGDKRILMIDGNPVPYALLRTPIKGEIRGNLAAGGRGTVIELSARDRWICAEIGPTLREKGLYFAGIDVIGDYLTEINITSPTCIREIAKETGLDIAGDLLRCLEAKEHAGNNE